MAKRVSLSIAKAPTCLTVVQRPTAELRPDPRNPRKHLARQVRQIARSIEAFGFNVPILVDGSGQVIAGHGRLLACRQLGWTEVPTICLDHLSDAQARAFMVADNRLSETSSWDDQLLAETLRDLSAMDLDFSIEAIGFEMGEIDFRIEGLTETPVGAGEVDRADLVSAQPAGPAVALPGDLWLLGRHRLLCASALDEASYAVLMDGAKAAMIFTDPPYNVPIQGHVSGLGAVRHREFAMASGEMTASEFTGFLRTALRHLAQQSRDGALHFVCMDWRHMNELLAAGGEVYSELKNLCVWAKDNAGMGSLYRSQHELVFVYKHGTASHRNNVQLGTHGRNRTNLWRYPGVNSFGRKGEEGSLLALHPTVKPVQLVADAILDCSARGKVVLDAFLGSGTTLIAAERVGRRCYGLEIDPHYVDTAIRRWQLLTGEVAVHARSGVKFNDVAMRATNRPTSAAPHSDGGRTNAEAVELVAQEMEACNAA
ncbi:MAG: ParB N-terminal domain-containing protein [Gemmatimonadaceae bacterium]|nr:ParB N-terminal domain-containing protein [Acetobacteraceae bacterium]